MNKEELAGIVISFIPSSPSLSVTFVSKFMIPLVAGAGFEPATFGL